MALHTTFNFCEVVSQHAPGLHQLHKLGVQPNSSLPAGAPRSSTQWQRRWCGGDGRGSRRMGRSSRRMGRGVSSRTKCRQGWVGGGGPIGWQAHQWH